MSAEHILRIACLLERIHVCMLFLTCFTNGSTLFFVILRFNN